jgi:AraC-like DNA-binding protein
MPSAHPPGLTRFRTHDLPGSRRLTGWEEHNARALVGLRARPFGDRPFDGTEINLTLPRLRLARVSGSPHAVERDVRQIAEHPADGVVVYFALAGASQFEHRGGRELIVPGQGLVVDGDQPFQRAFSHGLTELVLKAPRTLVRGIRPVRPHAFGFQGNAHARALVTAVSGALRGGPADWEDLEHVATSLLGTLLGGERSDTGDLAAAHAHIAAHLADQDLSASRIAAAIGYSERHLSRLFARSGQSVPQAVLTARLDAARRLLAEPISLAEVASRSGFASQAHFSRTYRARFGTTPCKDRRA